MVGIADKIRLMLAGQAGLKRISLEHANPRLAAVAFSRFMRESQAPRERWEHALTTALSSRHESVSQLALEWIMHADSLHLDRSLELGIRIARESKHPGVALKACAFVLATESSRNIQKARASDMARSVHEEVRKKVEAWFKEPRA